jgi:hypothetical protein
MKEVLQKLVIGSGGLVTTELVQTAEMLNPEEITTAGNLIIQIIIGIVTIFGLFKKRKK